MDETIRITRHRHELLDYLESPPHNLTLFKLFERAVTKAAAKWRQYLLDSGKNS